MSYKKRLIILVSSVFIYIIIIFIYNKINASNYNEAFVLKNDVLRGQTLKESDFKQIKLKENDIITNLGIFITDKIENYVPRKDLSKGCILLKEDVIEKNEYNKSAEDTEIISIKISNPEDIVSYQIEKNSIVNLYYTGKLKLAKGILEDIDLPSIATKNSNIDSEYVTIKLIENIKVIDLFDKYGNVIERGNYVKNEASKIDTIMFELKKDLVIKINNLKKYGEFSISIKR